MVKYLVMKLRSIDAFASSLDALVSNIIIIFCALVDDALWTKLNHAVADCLDELVIVA